MEGASPTCADVDDCLGLPAIPPPQAGQGGKKNRRAATTAEPAGDQAGHH